MRSTLMKKLRGFRSNDEGVTLVEYGIGLTLAVVVGTFLLNSLGVAVKDEMKDACTTLNTSGTTNTATC